MGDKGSDVDGQDMDTLVRELANIGEELIPEVPEMLLGCDSSADSIKGKPEFSLALWGDGAIV